MNSCEIMDGANYICTDQIGTFTKIEMSVFQVLTGKSKMELKQNVEVENIGKLNEEKTTLDETNKRRLYTLFKSDKY